MWGARVIGATVDHGAPYLQTIALNLKVQRTKNQNQMLPTGHPRKSWFLNFPADISSACHLSHSGPITILTQMQIENQIHPIWGM